MERKIAVGFSDRESHMQRADVLQSKTGGVRQFSSIPNTSLKGTMANCYMHRRKVSSILAVFTAVIVIPCFGCTNAVPSRCCDEGFILNDFLECIEMDSNTTTWIEAVNETYNTLNRCSHDVTDEVSTGVNTTDKNCTDILTNGTVVTLSCNSLLKNHANNHCDSIFKLLSFWGATMMVFATIFYTLPYVIVIVVYCSYSDLRKRAYDKSLISYNFAYVTVNTLIITIGSLELCHHKLPDYVYGILGLIILYFTQATCIWLFLLCFDMTLVITRFQWAPSSNSRKKDEMKKFKVYSMWSWGLSTIPAVIATLMEFIPVLSNDSALRPNFSKFDGKSHTAIMIYTLTIPVITLLTNTILFMYTSYRMIKVQRDNAILNKNNIKNVKKKYFVYLRLYLIMDAPWLSGALSAIYPSLWILKFVRIIHPILMLYIILPKKRILQVIGCMKGSQYRESRRSYRDNAQKPLNEIAKC